MINIKDILAGGQAKGLKNTKHMRMLQNLKWRQVYQSAEYYKYIFMEDVSFQLKQISNGEMKGLGTGTFVWPAAQVLSKYLEKQYGPDGLKGKKVCELGSGVGLTGIIAGLLGAEVVLTDHDVILPLLQENLQIVQQSLLSSNHTEIASALINRLSIEKYDWQEETSLSELAFDLLLVSDCVLPKLYPIALLVQAVEKLMKEHTIALFSYEHRFFPDYDPRQEFIRLCALCDLHVTLLPLSTHHPDFNAEDIEIWAVERNRHNNHLTLFPTPGNNLVLSTWGEEKKEIKIQLKINNSPPPRASTTTIRSFAIAQRGGREGIGGVLWPASVVLSRYLLRRAGERRQEQGDEERGKEREGGEKRQSEGRRKRRRVLELGAGCGLTAIIAFALGDEVTATDREGVCGVLGENVERARREWGERGERLKEVEVEEEEGERREGGGEGERGEIRVVPFDWSSPSPALISSLQAGDFDLILCSDCLYSSSALSPLLSLLSSLSTSRRCEVVIINELRSALEEFLYEVRRLEEREVEMEEREIEEEERVLVRNGEEIVYAPPLRLLSLYIGPKEREK